jgi:hypothetical protein
VEAIEASSPFKQEGEQPGSPPQSGWKLTKLHDWICNHPILANVDNDFLAKVVAIRKSASHKAADETSRDDAKLAAGNWVGKYPFLRVLHAIIYNEDIKGSCLCRVELPSGHMAIENSVHIVSVWTKIA